MSSIKNRNNKQNYINNKQLLKQQQLLKQKQQQQQLLKQQQQQLLKQQQQSFKQQEILKQDKLSLHQIGLKHKTNKATFHKYCDFYEKELSNISPKRILEIGIGTPNTVGSYGSSLKMWSEFFPNSIVVGCDIDRIAVNKKYGKNIITRFVDSSQIKSIKKCVNNEMYDIIIDDGSHLQSHQHNSLEALWDNLSKGGVFIMEDIHHFDPKKSKFAKTRHDDPYNPHTKILLENEKLQSSRVPSMDKIRSELSQPIKFFVGTGGANASMTAILHKK